MGRLSGKGNVITFIKNWRTYGSTMSWLIKYTKPFIRSLLFLLVLDVAATGVSISMTLIGRHIIDSATAGNSFSQSVMIYICIIVVSLLIGVLSHVLAALINERFAFSIRLHIYDSVMHTCWEDISKFHSGDIIMRLTSDVDIVATGIAEVLPSIVSLGISLIAAFITLAYFDFGIALFALLLAPVTALIGIISGRLMGPIQAKIQQSESAYKSYMQESVANLTIFKAFGAESQANKVLTELRTKRLKWMLKRQKISAVNSAILNFSFQLGYISAFVYSAFKLSRNLITYGTMSVFISLVGQIQAPVVGISKLIPRFVSIFTSANRIIELDEMSEEEMTIPLFSTSALGLLAKKISFSYGQDVILKSADLKIYPGEFVAMMGSSGVGKTTFIRLIMSYLTPNQGSIVLVDSLGKENEITAGIRTYISYVPQGNTLMSGRIIDNIRLGAPEISEEEIWTILNVVAVDDFVKGTPDGLYTVIGERGLGLSEGQAQRLAIARALAKNAPFLILDEATSALDEQTELAVLNHLYAHKKGITCLLVTHRRSVLAFCDRSIRIAENLFVEEKMPLNEK